MACFACLPPLYNLRHAKLARPGAPTRRSLSVVPLILVSEGGVMGYVIVKYLHFIGIFGLFALLLLEFYLVKPVLSGAMLTRLANVDLIYWTFGILVVVTGIMLTVSVGKPASFFLSNPVYHIKVTLFGVAILATTYPTFFFQTHRHCAATEEIDVPRTAAMIIRLKFPVLFLLPLLAALMAQGYGY